MASSVKIREVAKVIFHLIDLIPSLPGVKYGALYNRNLEMNKVAALKFQREFRGDNVHLPQWYF